MTNEYRNPSEIEREIEQQRASLSSNLEGLQEKFSVETMVRQIGDQFREHGGDLGKSISDQVKANPIPLALTGIGLAWMMFGNSKPTRAEPHYPTDEFMTAEERYRRQRLAEGHVYTPPATTVRTSSTRPSWAMDDDDGSWTDRVSEGADNAKDRVSRGAAAVKGKVSSAASTVSDGASSGASRASSAASSAASAVSSGLQSAKDGLSSAGSRIAEGTENLTEEGRNRVIAARRKAIDLHRRASMKASEGADKAADLFDRQPLVVGALALAAGAALGGALPGTRKENELMGEHRDNLFDEAERIFREETEKAKSVAQSVKGEVKDIASEIKTDLNSGAPGDKSAVEAVGDKAKSAANRVAGKAKESAKKENLGNPKA